MMKAQHVIWSNYDLDYERDWKGLLEEEYPDMTEEERELLMYEMNNSYLDDERCNLNIQLDCPIIVIADLGLWHGRASGYREIESGNVRDCLYSGRSIEYSTWFVDDLGDLRCTAIHHDGRNHLPYRVYKENATDAQIERLKESSMPARRRGQILPVSRGGLATKLPAFMAGKSGKEVRHNES